MTRVEYSRDVMVHCSLQQPMYRDDMKMQVERRSIETRQDFPRAEPLEGARNDPVRIQIHFHRLTKLHSTRM
jgi:hypothetical protein